MKHNFRASHPGSKNLSQLQHQRRATRVAATVSTVSSFNQLQRIFSPRDFAGCLHMWVDRDRHTMSLRALTSFQKAKACSLLLQM